MNLFSGEDYVWRNSVGPEVPCPWLLHHQPHAAQQDYQGTRRWVVQSSQECIQRFWPKYVIIIYHHRSSILSSRNKITNVTGPNLEKYYSISCCWVFWWWHLHWVVFEWKGLVIGRAWNCYKCGYINVMTNCIMSLNKNFKLMTKIWKVFFNFS